MRRVRVNQAFAPQRVTGQQRYATEISRRLRGRTGFVDLAPHGRWARSALRVWAWVLLVAPVRAGGSVLLSMTARAPLWARRQVLVVHDLFVLTNPEWFSRAYVWTHAPLLRAQLRTAAAVVAVSQPVADEVARRYRGPVAVAPNGPSAVFAEQTAESDVLTRRALVEGRFLLAVGNLEPRKNLALLAQAYGRLDPDERASFPLVVVGGGSAIYADETAAWPEGTVDAGYVSDEELRDLYRSCRALVLVSRAEGFGLPLVEAAAAGVRGLVLSDLPVFRWICGDHATYVDPGSVESVAGGLRSAIDDPVRQRIDLDRFSWDASAQTVADTCLAVRRGGRG